MSRVTYILGAGASYGDRRKDERGIIVEFSRGLPVVNELERSLQLLKQGDTSSGVVFSTEEAKKRGVTIEQYNKVQSCLSLLEEACSSYPTIDTLAKQIYVTNLPSLSRIRG